MYNILNHLREVFEVLDRRGFSYEVPRNILLAELKRSTSIFNDKTLNKWMHNFKELGYIRMKNPAILERCLNFDNPYIFSDGADYIKPFEDSQPNTSLETPIKDIDVEITKMKEAKSITDEK